MGCGGCWGCGDGVGHDFGGLMVYGGMVGGGLEF